MSSPDPYSLGTLVRSAFCSEANFSHWADPRGTELEVARILHPAPHNEHFELIGGVFHAGNRYYFQVIEGPGESVNWYLDQVRSDDRHQNHKVLLTEPVERMTFKPGKMRFVGTQADMHAIQEQADGRVFQPYDYTRDMIHDFVKLAV